VKKAPGVFWNESIRAPDKRCILKEVALACKPILSPQGQRLTKLNPLVCVGCGSSAL
jgi:hypothetical protein